MNYPMKIDKNICNNKNNLLEYFRSRASETLSELALQYSAVDYKQKASAVNHAIIKSKESIINILIETAKKENWTNYEILKCILMITYTNDVVMLETRNSVWKYDYMAFSRRIGELWEPLCKLCFQYPINDLNLFIPPLFSEVKKNLTDEISQYIQTLPISEEEKVQLRKYYDKVWNLVTSGEIQLECDLHFTDGKKKYVVDFKSGFSSNEKGNTNRLLLVGSIYQNIENEDYECMLFVRSNENNSYLNTLQNSGVWSTFCGNETYNQIENYTGFNIHSWIEENINWLSDFNNEMSETIDSENLTNYLIW